MNKQDEKNLTIDVYTSNVIHEDGDKYMSNANCCNELYITDV